MNDETGIYPPILLVYEGWQISIVSNKFGREIAVWDKYSSGEDGDIHIIDRFGHSLDGFIHLLEDAKNYINQKKVKQ